MPAVHIFCSFAAMDKNSRNYRILLLGDGSGYHRCLAEGLRRLGHEVAVASNGSLWMDTERDVDISRRFNGKLGGFMLYVKLRNLLSGRLSGFDIVSINGTNFAQLRPERLLALADILKKNNSHFFQTLLGTDSNYVEECLDPFSKLQYSEWSYYGTETRYRKENSADLARWLSPELKALCRKVYRETEGTVTALYEYDIAARRILEPEKIGYAGIPIDTLSVTPVELPDNPSKVKLFLGMHKDRMLEKGTDRILAAAKRVVDKYPDRCALEIVENLPYAEYTVRMRNAHVVLDQLYSYTPATNALLAMAMGLNTLSGGEAAYYDFIGERQLRPVINAIPDDEALYKTLESVVLNPRDLRSRGLQGREFVVRHNDTVVVAKRFLEFWERRVADGKNA